MTKEIKEYTEEEQFIQRQKKRTRIRILLIIINILLMSILLFEVVRYAIDIFKGNEEENKITLCGRNAKNSEKYFDNFSSSYDVNDYALYGQYLHLSKYAITPGSLSEIGNISLHNICDENFQHLNSLSFNVSKEKLDQGLNLFAPSIVDGEYFLINDYKGTSLDTPIRILSEKLINQTLYSLPSETGKRKKVVLLSSSANKATVIKVSTVESIPSTYKDVVIISSDEELLTDIVLPNSHYKLAMFTKEDRIEETLKIKSNYFIAIDDNVTSTTVSSHIVSSSYLKGQTYQTGVMESYDKNFYLRELGGKANGSSLCNAQEPNSCLISQYNTDLHAGKYGFVIPQIDAKTSVQNVLNYLQ